MVRLFGKPVLEHTIDLLKRHGIRDIIITAAYKADQIISYFGSGLKWGVNIQYFLEDVPKGTAGGLRTIQPVLKDTFIIVSGDAVTDFDLRMALDYHESKSAVATMLLYETEDPSRFGIVECCGDGRIQRFLEKPKPHETFTSTINTGIYVLEPEVISYIPCDAAYDFSRDVFPRMLQNREPFYALRTEGYWCDMGSLSQYRNVHFDALNGRVRLNLPTTRVTDGIWIGEDADIHPSVRLRSPLYVGSGTHVRKNASLGRFAVVGDMAVVDEEAKVTHSVMGAAASVGREAHIYGSVLGTGFSLPDGHQLQDEVVVHDGSGLSLRAEIDQRLVSQHTTEEHTFTWSGLELKRLVSEVTSIQAAAA
jgi:mannose-1-phosphate guanylyltransferase/phosphomannomutase